LLAKVEAAQADGRWSALDAVETLEIPADLAQALAEYASACDHFAAFPRSVKRGILEWIANAKTAATRSPRTVNRHLSLIYTKLGVSSRQVATRLPSITGWFEHAR
jgi:uncharacterized protein YdeI (YjbR/CyaY-like superfamily)